MRLTHCRLPVVLCIAALTTPLLPAQTFTWTNAAPSGLAAFSENMQGVTYGAGRFVAAGSVTGSSTSHRIAFSTDLVNWTTATTPAVAGNGLLRTAAYGNGLYAVGVFGQPVSNTQKLYTSTDAVNWTLRDVRLGTVWGIDYLNGLWIAVGDTGNNTGNLSTSTDGITWTARATGSADDLIATAFGAGLYVAVGNGSQAVTSTDGSTWTRRTLPDSGVTVTDIVYAAGKFVASTLGGAVYTSADGLAWTRQTVAVGARLNTITYGNGVFVAGGDAIIATSPDAITWTTNTTNVRTIRQAVFGGGVFVAGADIGAVYRSGLPTVLGPVISSQPQATSAVAGGSATFSVTASGTGNTFQWKRNGTAIFGATSATLVLTGANVIAGSYIVDITNADGTATSSAAVLTIVSASAAGRLGNMSIRTNAGTGDNTLIVGLAVGGPGTSGTKPILIRGVGPTLAAFNLSGTLADPVMTVFQGSTQVDQNDDWTGSFNFSSVGAFAFSGAAPRDAAIYSASTSAGSYSIQIAGKNNGTGLALAEIYDATPSDNFAATTPRLVNVSARTQVGTGDNILIAGFAVSGSSAVRVLIRAVGPTLGAAPFNVGGTLADPKLEIYSGSTKTIENDNWAGTAELKAAFSAVAAFAFSADTSRDAALVATLQPGSYTAQISGVGNTSGVALVEIYELR